MPESTAVINELEKLNNSIEEHINFLIKKLESMMSKKNLVPN